MRREFLGFDVVLYFLVPLGLALEFAARAAEAVVLFPFDLLEQLKWTSER